MIYRIYFNLTGCFDVEADSEDEALEEFNNTTDYSDFINSTDAHCVLIEESR